MNVIRMNKCDELFEEIKTLQCDVCQNGFTIWNTMNIITTM